MIDRLYLNIVNPKNPAHSIEFMTGPSPIAAGYFGRIWRLRSDNPSAASINGHTLVLKQTICDLSDSSILQSEKELLKKEADFLRLAHPDWASSITTVNNGNHLLGIVMPFCKGLNLRHYHNHMLLTNTTFRRLSIQIIDAVLELHKKNIAHLDLKPDNILAVIDHDEVKEMRIIDFGAAEEINSLIKQEKIDVRCPLPHLTQDRLVPFDEDIKEIHAEARHDYFAIFFTLSYLYSEVQDACDIVKSRLEEGKQHYNKNDCKSADQLKGQLGRFFVEENDIECQLLPEQTRNEDDDNDELQFEFQDFCQPG